MSLTVHLQGSHEITLPDPATDASTESAQAIDRSLGPTCGILPVGVDDTILTTEGLEWNLGTFHPFTPFAYSPSSLHLHRSMAFLSSESRLVIWGLTLGLFLCRNIPLHALRVCIR